MYFISSASHAPTATVSRQEPSRQGLKASGLWCELPTCMLTTHYTSSGGGTALLQPPYPKIDCPQSSQPLPPCRPQDL